MKAKYKLGQLVRTYPTAEQGELFGQVTGVVLKPSAVEYLVGIENYSVKEADVAAAYREITPRKPSTKAAKKASKKETVAKSA